MDIDSALARASEAGAEVRGNTSPNPPVGAAILDDHGVVVGVGATQPAGGSHAEVVALAQAGAKARNGIAVVTLEPCNHTGRTGPCAQALIDAGIATVYYAVKDPNQLAAGGADRLRAAGVETHFLDRRIPDLEPWLKSVSLNRPHVTLKFAGTVDGFAAATDGSSQWITSATAREFVHADRANRDAIIVGTGTVLADNPSLTARCGGQLYPNQPRRVVVGSRTIPADFRLSKLGYEQYSGISEALTALWDTGCRDILIEGGPRLAAGFLQEDVVDAIQAYVAPALLGAGRSLLSWPSDTTISDIIRFETNAVQLLDGDVLIKMTRKER